VWINGYHLTKRGAEQAEAVPEKAPKKSARKTKVG
jgi:hypothetical protein